MEQSEVWIHTLLNLCTFDWLLRWKEEMCYEKPPINKAGWRFPIICLFPDICLFVVLGQVDNNATEDTTIENPKDHIGVSVGEELERNDVFTFNIFHLRWSDMKILRMCCCCCCVLFLCCLVFLSCLAVVEGCIQECRTGGSGGPTKTREWIAMNLGRGP